MDPAEETLKRLRESTATSELEPAQSLLNATVCVRIEFSEKVLDYSSKTGGVPMAMGQLGG